MTCANLVLQNVRCLNCTIYLKLDNILKSIITLVASMSPRFSIYLLLLLVIVIYGFRNYKLLSKEFKLLVLFVTYVFISELFGKYLSNMYGNNMILYHIIFPVQICFYGMFYQIVIRNWRNTIIFTTSIFIVCTIINSMFFQSIEVFPSHDMVFSSILAIPLCLLQFKELATNKSKILIHQNSLFWFSLGSLLFNTLTFFAFGYFNLFGNEIPDWVFILIWCLNMVLYGCYFYALRLNLRDSKGNNTQFGERI